MTMPGEAWTALERHLAGAELALQEVAGGRSMCAIGRSGQSFPAAKYHEGALSALREARREILRRSHAGEMVDVKQIVRETAQDWSRRTGGVTAASPDWRAYLAGGSEALEGLADE